MAANAEIPSALEVLSEFTEKDCFYIELM
jgi:hypothetical protein